MQSPAPKARSHAPARALPLYSSALAALVAFTGGACRSNAPDQRATELTPESSAHASSATPASPSASPKPGYRTYGAPLAAGNVVALANVAKNPEAWNKRTITVEGDVRRACTRKGCWMEIVDPTSPETTRCRVTFKDYGFFVPTTSAGAKARVQGEAEFTKVTADYVEHLESEGAQFPRKHPDGSAEELHIIATGVELLQAG